MFCSTCGVAVTQGLSYCNYCGAKLNPAKGDSKTPQLPTGLLIPAISFLFIFGLVAIGMLMGIMKVVLELPIEAVLGFSLLPFLLLLLLEFVFIRLLLRSRRGADEARDPGPLKGSATKELDGRQMGALPEHQTSVTEHTTRTFDPIYKDRFSK